MRNKCYKFVQKREDCYQRGDRMSKNDKSCHICSMRLKEAFG